MQPYRAHHAAFGDVVVIGAFLPEQLGVRAVGLRLLAVSTSTGAHVEGPPSAFVCTEPTYLGQADPEAEHEHDWATTGGKPVVEGGRLVGIAFGCVVDGCPDTILRAAEGAVRGAVSGAEAAVLKS